VEACEDKRKQYKQMIKNIPPQSLVYIDESGIEMTICKDRGWGKKSEKLIGKRSGKYYERTNIIAGYVKVSVKFPAGYDLTKSLVSMLYGRIARNSFSFLAL